MEKELLFALVFIGVVLMLMRPRNYRRWTGWLGRRSKATAPVLPPRQHRVRPEVSRLSDEDVAARLEKALYGDMGRELGNGAPPEVTPIAESLLVRLASELNAYRVSPWNARKVVWIEDLSPAVAARLAAAMGSLELGELPVIEWKGQTSETPEATEALKGASRWVCVVTSEFPVADLRKALVFVLGAVLIPESYRPEKW